MCLSVCRWALASLAEMSGYIVSASRSVVQVVWLCIQGQFSYIYRSQVQEMWEGW